MRRREEGGSASVWMLVWLIVIAFVAHVGLVVAALVARQHQVDAAADLAALSAATRLQRGGEPCPVAQTVAAAHDVAVQACHVQAEDVRVDVVARARLPLGLSIELQGIARAGP